MYVKRQLFVSDIRGQVKQRIKENAMSSADRYVDTVAYKPRGKDERHAPHVT